MRKFFKAKPWGQTCPAGAPVPEPHRCSALHCASVPLAEMRAGTEVRVTCLDAAHSDVAARLASMGILPGVRLRILRRSPAFVFRIDHAEFAIDRELASLIRVLPEPSPF